MYRKETKFERWRAKIKWQWGIIKTAIELARGKVIPADEYTLSYLIHMWTKRYVRKNKEFNGVEFKFDPMPVINQIRGLGGSPKVIFIEDENRVEE